MNRETRTFIWGLFIMIFCTFALAGFILHIMRGNREWYYFIGAAICMINSYIGFSKIKKVTD